MIQFADTVISHLLMQLKMDYLEEYIASISTKLLSLINSPFMSHLLLYDNISSL